jgi:hypothetical protein
MEFENSWRAVRNPGSATDLFAPPPTRPLVATSEFSITNAWWLAELSRLVYRNDAPRGAWTRDGVLARVGLKERHFLNGHGTQCAIVEPRAAAAEPLAALVFRGTTGPVDWRRNARTLLVDWPEGGRVHAGFIGALEGVWAELAAALDAGSAPVFYTGHSLGGALAMLAASRRPPLAVYSFGAPRVGDAGFAEALPGVAAYRVVNRRDTVARHPLRLPGLRFRQAGEPCSISFDASEGRARLARGGVRRGTLPSLPGPRRRWFDPPASLCDHAPVNYVACLERLATAGE